ncbi:hypothetical protein Zmor_016106 [Zophobas morio]|uniref:THAP-type domain-containing protein n=1 Tax=Zophobas morio TaxID=2755281 RepID=A0AA38II47_9CUCU|nr:hypothetical protein Zmor_016106 [Zophobas morio]
MRGCCIANCNNRSEKGFRLFSLPSGKKSANRKNAWIKFINRKNLPARASVCEAHFEETQFETQRTDGRRLLKWNAVPTLKCKIPESAQIYSIDTEGPLVTEDVNNELENSTQKSPNTAESTAGDLNFVTNLQFQRLKNELQAAQHKIRQLEKKINNLKGNFKKAFSEDQVHYLEIGGHRGVEWSDESINKALRLYMACGAKGYEEVKRQNLPYPSI